MVVALVVTVVVPVTVVALVVTAVVRVTIGNSISGRLQTTKAFA
jgi:hypothetical protein